jgi:hypothetical protein
MNSQAIDFQGFGTRQTQYGYGQLDHAVESLKYSQIPSRIDNPLDSIDLDPVHLHSLAIEHIVRKCWYGGHSLGFLALFNIENNYETDRFAYISKTTTSIMATRAGPYIPHGSQEGSITKYVKVRRSETFNSQIKFSYITEPLQDMGREKSQNYRRDKYVRDVTMQIVVSIQGLFDEICCTLLAVLMIESTSYEELTAKEFNILATEFSELNDDYERRQAMEMAAHLSYKTIGCVNTGMAHHVVESLTEKMMPVFGSDSNNNEYYVVVPPGAMKVLIKNGIVSPIGRPNPSTKEKAIYKEATTKILSAFKGKTGLISFAPEVGATMGNTAPVVTGKQDIEKLKPVTPIVQRYTRLEGAAHIKLHDMITNPNVTFVEAPMVNYRTNAFKKAPKQALLEHEAIVFSHINRPAVRPVTGSKLEGGFYTNMDASTAELTPIVQSDAVLANSVEFLREKRMDRRQLNARYTRFTPWDIEVFEDVEQRRITVVQWIMYIAAIAWFERHPKAHHNTQGCNNYIEMLTKCILADNNVTKMIDGTYGEDPTNGENSYNIIADRTGDYQGGDEGPRRARITRRRRRSEGVDDDDDDQSAQEGHEENLEGADSSYRLFDDEELRQGGLRGRNRSGSEGSVTTDTELPDTRGTSQPIEPINELRKRLGRSSCLLARVIENDFSTRMIGAALKDSEIDMLLDYLSDTFKSIFPYLGNLGTQILCPRSVSFFGKIGLPIPMDFTQLRMSVGKAGHVIVQQKGEVDLAISQFNCAMGVSRMTGYQGQKISSRYLIFTDGTSVIPGGIMTNIRPPEYAGIASDALSFFKSALLGHKATCDRVVFGVLPGYGASTATDSSVLYIEEDTVKTKAHCGFIRSPYRFGRTEYYYHQYKKAVSRNRTQNEMHPFYNTEPWTDVYQELKVVKPATVRAKNFHDRLKKNGLIVPLISTRAEVVDGIRNNTLPELYSQFSPTNNPYDETLRRGDQRQQVAAGRGVFSQRNPIAVMSL